MRVSKPDELRKQLEEAAAALHQVAEELPEPSPDLVRECVEKWLRTNQRLLKLVPLADDDEDDDEDDE